MTHDYRFVVGVGIGVLVGALGAFAQRCGQTERMTSSPDVDRGTQAARAAEQADRAAGNQDMVPWSPRIRASSASLGLRPAVMRDPSIAASGATQRALAGVMWLA
jgi:hypothetical protein